MVHQQPIPADIMDIAVSIEKDIPSRVTGANRVFIRAVIARAIFAERERCAKLSLSHVGIGSASVAKAICAGTPCP